MDQSLWRRLQMSTQIGKITYDIDYACYVNIPDEKTAEELSEWSKNNHYPAFVNCTPGYYVWDDDFETFFKRESNHKEGLNMEDMSIQLTLTGEEIEQLAKATGGEIKDKEDLYQAVLMAIEKYVETYERN